MKLPLDLRHCGSVKFSFSEPLGIAGCCYTTALSESGIIPAPNLYIYPTSISNNEAFGVKTILLWIFALLSKSSLANTHFTK